MSQHSRLTRSELDTLLSQNAALLVRLACKRGVTVATCESLTAGLLAATIAEVPGASAVLRGGLITYASNLKHSLAGVPEAVIEEHTVVSEAVARMMARGAQVRCGADYGFSLTGVAGPEPQDGHSVGTVWLGIAGPVGEKAIRLGGEEGLHGDRAWIRQVSVAYALDWAVDAIGEQIV
ncbi:CinA family protein [Corynebacterium gerontici]|uniref:Competence-damage inducible protein n=1 Tax=Corynebacterium gerontici TaxID=2079234 RepID=A0A3G6J125_9CORY|nr:nicotinamide-nucleotide amidohydrolase family protein [Corynebacterium gerontici]AZA11616.1 Putative competence-damage inducible protein [Corynebacterium gerontici]